MRIFLMCVESLNARADIETNFALNELLFW